MLFWYLSPLFVILSTSLLKMFIPKSLSCSIDYALLFNDSNNEEIVEFQEIFSIFNSRPNSYIGALFGYQTLQLLDQSMLELYVL